MSLKSHFATESNVLMWLSSDWETDWLTAAARCVFVIQCKNSHLDVALSPSHETVSHTNIRICWAEIYFGIASMLKCLNSCRWRTSFINIFLMLSLLTVLLLFPELFFCPTSWLFMPVSLFSVLKDKLRLVFFLNQTDHFCSFYCGWFDTLNNCNS